MEEELNAHNEEERIIGPIEAYNILLRSLREENRLLSERTTIFLAASSILFLAFVMLFQGPILCSSCIKYLIIFLLPVLGLFLTFVFYSLARGTFKRLKFLWHKQENLERESQEFVWMRERGIAPEIDRTEYKNIKREWGQEDSTDIWLQSPSEESCWGKISSCLSEHASERWIPFTFVLLWLASLIVAIKSVL